MKSIPDASGYYLDEYDGPRFWEHVTIHGGNAYLQDPLARLDNTAGECWLWSGWHEPEEGYEYGRFNVFGKPQQAHRIAYRDFGGRIGDGERIDHLCRNARCVRPAHLEPVTQAENMRRGKLGLVRTFA